MGKIALVEIHKEDFMDTMRIFNDYTDILWGCGDKPVDAYSVSCIQRDFDSNMIDSIYISIWDDDDPWSMTYGFYNDNNCETISPYEFMKTYFGIDFEALDNDITLDLQHNDIMTLL